MWNKRNKEVHKAIEKNNPTEPSLSVEIKNQEGELLDGGFDLIKFTQEIITLVTK